MGDGIDQPAQARRPSSAVDVERPALEPDDRGGGKLSHPAFVDADRQPGLQSDPFGGADEIELVGVAIAKGELPMKLPRVGPDSVVGGDSAQGAQTAVERRRFAGGGSRLFHLQALSRNAFLTTKMAKLAVVFATNRQSNGGHFRFRRPAISYQSEPSPD